jgi:5'-nucleotidase
MHQKPLILITNDDGINAPGIHSLIEAVKTLGEIYVVAPDKPQSGMGHAITLNSTLRVQEHKNEKGFPQFSTSGTPVDCVKLAIKKLLPRKPDLLVSGINHGSNSSISVIYSGTMSAAVEGALENIPSIGFSLCNHSIDADFSAAIHIAHKIVKNVLNQKMPDYTCLNVNIPAIDLDLINGIKVCRSARAYWEEDFDERIDPYGRKYYWLTGSLKNYDDGEDTDEWALANNYVSVVPIHFDMTAHEHLKTIESWNLSI